jgi:hypothetical protein
VASIGSGETETDSDALPLTTLGFSELPIINLELAPLTKVRAANTVATAAARMYLKLSMASLTSFLIGPWKKTGLLFGVSGGSGLRLLPGLGSLQLVFLYRF